MYAMFRKVNARENIVGWYSTGPRIRASDLDINELFRKYHPNPIYVIIDVQPKQEFEIPTKSYVAIEEVKEDGSEAPSLTFQHVPSEIGALEAEEVGVEHLLRDIKDTTVSTLSNQINTKLNALKSMISHLKEMHQYLESVCAGKMPLNQQILFQVQDIFNYSPNLNVEDLAHAFREKNNDLMLVIYLSSMIRSIIALHNLINNKVDNRDYEKKEDLQQQSSEGQTPKSDNKKSDSSNTGGGNLNANVDGNNTSNSNSNSNSNNNNNNNTQH